MGITIRQTLKYVNVAYVILSSILSWSRALLVFAR